MRNGWFLINSWLIIVSSRNQLLVSLFNHTVDLSSNQWETVNFYLIPGWSLNQAESTACFFDSTTQLIQTVINEKRWNLFDSWLIVDSSRIQLLICLIQPHCWFNQQPSRSGRSEIVFRFTVDSSKTQLLYSSTWLIHSADNCKTWKKRPSVTKTLTGQIKRCKSIFNISMQRVNPMTSKN